MNDPGSPGRGVSDLFEAYLGGAAERFYPGHFGRAADRRAAVARAERPLAPAVAAALERQSRRLPPCPAREAALGLLRRGAAAVVTGQQMGLFLGPLFTFYKAATAVAAARALAAESGRPVVPVFWLQTEDHDLPEIAECRLPCAAGEPLELRLPAPAGGRVSVAHLALPDEVSERLAQLAAEIANLPHAAAHVERLARHYRPGNGWAAAFAGVLAEVFEGEGLVIVDPRDPELAAVAAAVHRRALEDAAPLAAVLEERGRELAAAGFAPAVYVRPGAPLSFFHPEGVAGPRYRLAPDGGDLVEVGGTGRHARRELLAALAREPLAFSSSVLLRPLVQDSLLPSAAYVGGPAEIAYFAQIAPLYDALGVAMPLLVPRARLRLLEERSVRLLERLGLSPAAVERPQEELLAAACGAAPAHLEAAALAAELLRPFDQALATAGARLAAAGPGLPPAIDKTRAAVEAAVGRLVARYERALLHADRERVDGVRALRAMLFPGGVPQERAYGLSYFAARWGEAALLERVLADCDPFAGAWRDLRLPAAAEDASGSGRCEARP